MFANVALVAFLTLAVEPGVLRSESFDDVQFGDREWYDFTKVRIAEGASAGKGCLEFE
jgi:hypothetical protein